MSWGYADEEAERELEQARAEDQRRSSGAKTMGQILPMRGPVRTVPPQVAAPAHEERLLTCCACGFASSTHRGWRVDPRPPRPRGVVCAGRYDETGAHLDCYEKFDIELAIERGREVQETRLRIRAERERQRSSGPRGGGYEP
jgi:hypothetical protein